MVPTLSRILSAALLVAGSLQAQTTHFVDNGPGFDFVPQNVTIQLGDTVTWVWKGGLHTVDSGVLGVPDGAFTSGPVIDTVGHTFSVTFDAAFVAANPVPGGVYNYYCIIHGPLGQVGTVVVNQPPAVTAYGCLNPAGSLTTLAGKPAVGDTWRLGVDNPLGTQPAGSLAFVSLASAAAPGFPCGLALPGFGMAGPGAVGELLVDLTAPNPLVTLGPSPWSGAGNPAALEAVFPSDSALVGLQLYAQGLLVDPGAGPGAVVFGATEGLAATVGS